MRSTFAGLNLALRSLIAQQLAVDVTNQNIGNANTVGYSRQNVDLVATPPYTVPSANRLVLVGQIGTGVQVEAIRRSRSVFHDFQFRFESQSLGQWQVRRDALIEVERIFNEPSDSGLNAVIGRFWNAWREMANSPESLALRQGLKQASISLVEQFQHTSLQLQTLRGDLDYQVNFKVAEINTIATRIAALNRQVSRSVAAGDNPNDLRDQRDRLLDELSQIVNLTYRESPEGLINITIGGQPLVVGERAFAMRTEPDEANGNLLRVVWELDGSPVQVISGELYGSLTARDDMVTQKINELNRLVVNLATKVNEQHRLGVTLDGVFGGDFFTFAGAPDVDPSAMTIGISEAILNNLREIAAASAPDWDDSDPDASRRPGDGRNALAIADLQIARIGELQFRTFQDFYNAMITDLGVQGQQAQAISDNQQLLVQHINDRRDTESGVSLDEEASNLIRYQRAYEAAARLVTAFDEMLDRIINGMGLVGR